MNRRSVKIMRRKAGGTAGKNAEKYSVNLPAVWLRAMGIQKDNRVELSFDGEKITIQPLASTDPELFRRNAEQKDHRLKEYRYYDGDVLCTVILADFTARPRGKTSWPFWQTDAFRKHERAWITIWMPLAFRNMTRFCLLKRRREEWRRITNGWKLFDAAYQRQGCGDDFARKSGKMVRCGEKSLV